MYKNLTLYRCSRIDTAAAADALQAAPFVPCGPTEAQSIGFVPPRGIAHGALLETVAGNHHLMLRIERRQVPASVLRRRVDELASQIEKDTGRKPGAKHRKELKDEALLDLLPQAFTKIDGLRVWIDPGNDLLALDTTSTQRIDAALSLLTRALPDLQLQPLLTAEAPAACMRAWLSDNLAPEGFGIGRDALLTSPDASRGRVRYSCHSLDGEDVERHLLEGKQVQSLALHFHDRAEFVLTDALQLKAIKLDSAAAPDTDKADADPFDADAVLATSTLGHLIAELIRGLGGHAAELGADATPHTTH